MSVSRPRKRGREGFPPHLYVNPLRYIHPVTGQVFSWRKHTLEKAIEAAKILNSMLVDSDPVSEVLGDKNTLGKFLREFITKDGHLDQRKSERDLSEETISAYIRKVAILQKKDIAKKPTAEVTTFDLAELIKEYPTTQRNRYRSLLILIFDYAVSAGLTESNPARALMKKLEKVKRRRLTIEGFDAVYEKADVKTRQAMRLAIRSLQRREDLVRLKTGDIDSDPRGRFLPLIQIKTKMAVKIYLDKLLEADIDACRDAVASPYILHYGMESNKRRRAKPLTKDRLTRGFQETRDVTDYFQDMPNDERPTFHEIRALGSVLYLRAGKTIPEIQKLLGHKTEAQTRKYLARHGVEFSEAESGTFCTNIERILHASDFIS